MIILVITPNRVVVKINFKRVILEDTREQGVGVFVSVLKVDCLNAIRMGSAKQPRCEEVCWSKDLGLIPYVSPI